MVIAGYGGGCPEQGGGSGCPNGPVHVSAPRVLARAGSGAGPLYPRAETCAKSRLFTPAGSWLPAVEGCCMRQATRHRILAQGYGAKGWQISRVASIYLDNYLILPGFSFEPAAGRSRGPERSTGAGGDVRFALPGLRTGRIRRKGTALQRGMGAPVDGVRAARRERAATSIAGNGGASRIRAIRIFCQKIYCQNISCRLP